MIIDLIYVSKAFKIDLNDLQCYKTNNTENNFFKIPKSLFLEA